MQSPVGSHSDDEGDIDSDESIPEYGERAYWDERYTGRSDELCFEWYLGWNVLRPAFLPLLPPRPWRRVLVVGAGNSQLGWDLIAFQDAQCVVNLDFSSVVVDQMKAREPLPEGLHYVRMDAREMTFPDHSFDVILDKGTLDSILCGRDSFENAQKMLSEICRVLEPRGVSICISYGTPKHRELHFTAPGLTWDVRTEQLEGEEATTEGGQYYVYIATKWASR